MLSSPTLAEWLDTWIETYAPLRCSSLMTLQRYGSLARYLYRTPQFEAIAETALPQVTHQGLERGLLSLRTLKGSEALSARSICHAAALLRTALKKAWVLDLIRANPMQKVELPGFRRTPAACFLPDQLPAVRNAFRGDWMFPFIELAMATGCRRGELLALDWSDIDFDGQAVVISKALEQSKAGVRLKGTKSGHPRVLALPETALQALEAHRRGKPGQRLVFPDEAGRYRAPDAVSKLIVRTLRKAGLQTGSLHTLRHTHASLLLSRGIPLTVVSRRLGHASVDITARIYLHALPPDDRRSAEVWDQLIQR